MKRREKNRLISAVFTRFKIFLPVTYTDPNTQRTRYVQLEDISYFLSDIARKYKECGGYSISNPSAPPPIVGSYKDSPEERSYWAMILVPESRLNEVLVMIKKKVRELQSKYNQKEILLYYYQVIRLMPEYQK